MNILFTGASSFTGYWFVKQLAEAGWNVTATFTRKNGTVYADGGVREQRVARVQEFCKPVWDCRFGDEKFLDLLKTGDFNLLCHHAADVTDYKSPDFDCSGAVANNTRDIQNVVRLLAEHRGVQTPPILLTQSVFAGGYGAGTLNADGELPHFSPYGLSKALTAQLFRYYCDQAGVPVGEFVIPNPFGPYEEPRFTNYLMKTWFAGNKAGCNTPAYVRDNIHVELMARAYVSCAQQLMAIPDWTVYGPHGYIETQGAFAERFAREMRKRLNLPCELELADQTEFTEPRIRINVDTPDAAGLGFDESKAWDDVAAFYQSLYG
ncbi:MAG: NAD(P)-dependent oxidoreductase [Planctomycetota bacterium]